MILLRPGFDHGMRVKPMIFKFIIEEALDKTFKLQEIAETGGYLIVADDMKILTNS
jgi:hypothetical protein